MQELEWEKGRAGGGRRKEQEKRNGQLVDIPTQQSAGGLHSSLQAFRRRRGCVEMRRWEGVEVGGGREGGLGRRALKGSGTSDPINPVVSAVPKTPHAPPRRGRHRCARTADASTSARSVG